MKQEERSVIQPNYNLNGLLRVDRSIIKQLKEAAFSNKLKRARLCAHQNIDDKVHEMLIGFCYDSYIRPHRHTNKTESFHIIQGMIEIVLFNEKGNIKQRVLLGSLSSKYPFFFRSENHDWHTVLVHSKFALIHETTNGPFNPSESEFASWSPDPNDHEAADRFLFKLRENT